ncbi:hypothetical protein CTAYLR_007292 [Chrysophaeum taylorii]|uniref:Uncharacterized protein n=1 Tax=Chrysophaeum taylorii TaxID=2483200 RepID=A0AAD7UIH6_9STRA|nr:hypothetical protein CTAYLR_007292 [Chrysophaeum taylorii]
MEADSRDDKLDVSAARGSFLCHREVDELFYCATPRHQWDAMYYEGTLDDCRGLGVKLWECLRGKYAGTAAAEVGSACSEAGEHIWTLKQRPRWEYGDAPLREEEEEEKGHTNKKR